MYDIIRVRLEIGKCTIEEYYEIVEKARPLSGLFPTHADLFTEMHF